MEIFSGTVLDNLLIHVIIERLEVKEIMFIWLD